MSAAIIFGASRGIGENIAFQLFEKKGYSLCILGKTLEGKNGSLNDLKYKINQKGGDCLAIKCDVQNENEIESAIKEAYQYFQKKNIKIQLLVYNSGAIFHGKMAETTLKKYDLMHKVNARGCFVAILNTLKLIQQEKFIFIVLCPPIYQRFFRGKTAYAMTKISMSVLVKGLSFEFEGSNKIILGLWPATGVESAATKDFPSELLRKRDIMGETVVRICEDDQLSKINGNILIDEDYLRTRWEYNDFKKFRADENKEPPRMMPKVFPSLKVEEENWEGVFKIKPKL